MKRDRLNADEASRVKQVVKDLRIEDTLPGDDDIADVIPPCLKAWARSVPATGLWVVYAFHDASLTLWTIKNHLEVPIE